MQIGSKQPKQDLSAKQNKLVHILIEINKILSFFIDGNSTICWIIAKIHYRVKAFNYPTKNARSRFVCAAC